MSKSPPSWPDPSWFNDDPWAKAETSTGLDYWRLCDDLTVIQAALLAVGKEPTSDNQYDAERGDHPPVGYQGAREAIANALLRGAIDGQVVPKRGIGYDGCEGSGDWVGGTVDIFTSKVEVGSLRKWLAARDVKTGFFFPTPLAKQEYLDPNHPRYPPKLAAAVLAWQATESLSATRGKPPKKLLEEWLIKHADEFDLRSRKGGLNKTGIEEICKVANWQLSGGAPTTPRPPKSPPPQSQSKAAPKRPAKPKG